jgi:hypothetical protein
VSGLEMQFSDLGLSRFWFSPSVKNEFIELSEEALKITIQLSTTYHCEKRFLSLSLSQIRSKYRNSVFADLRMNLTNIEPDI